MKGGRVMRLEGEKGVRVVSWQGGKGGRVFHQNSQNQ